MFLTVTTHRLGVATFPGSLVRTTNEVVSSVSLDAESTGLTPGGGEAASFTVLVSRVTDPVDTRIITNSNVRGVHTDDLVVFKGGVLVNPVRVKHTQVHGISASTFLSNRFQVAVKFQVVDTSVHRLSVNNSVGDRPLTSTATNGHTIDAVSLLGLVAKLMSLVSTRGARQLHHLVSLAVLPGSINYKNSRMSTKKHKGKELAGSNEKKRRGQKAPRFL